jgi:hypothetical protein
MLEGRQTLIRMLIVMLFLVTAATDFAVRAEPEAAPAAAKATTAIKSLIDNDILQGDYFGANPTPSQPVTLAFYAVLLSRTLDLPAPAATTAPAGPSHWYAPSVATANRYGFSPTLQLRRIRRSSSTGRRLRLPPSAPLRRHMSFTTKPVLARFHALPTRTRSVHPRAPRAIRPFRSDC